MNAKRHMKQPLTILIEKMLSLVCNTGEEWHAEWFLTVIHQSHLRISETEQGGSSRWC